MVVIVNLIDANTTVFLGDDNRIHYRLSAINDKQYELIRNHMNNKGEMNQDLQWTKEFLTRADAIKEVFAERLLETLINME